VRLAAAEAQWQEQSARALAAARAGAEATRHQGIEIEFNRLRAELEAIQATLTDRETELAEAQLAIEQARERWQQELEAALSKAKKVWEAGETERLIVAKAQWHEQSAAAWAAAGAEVEAAHNQANESELGLPRAELAAVRAMLADREAELAEAHLAIEQARERWQQELEAALSKEKKVWEAGEIERLVGAKAQWQEKSAKALAAARAETETTRDTANAIEARRLRAECTALQAVLACREAELSQMQAAERERELGADNTHIVLKRERIRNYREEAEQELEARSPRHFLRDGIAAACLAILVMVFYPRIEPLILGSPAPASSPAPADAGVPSGSGAPSVAPAPASPAIVEQPLAVVIHAANVRAGPSGAADVIATLQLGVKVAIVEQRGNWTLIQINGESGDLKPPQGWVYSPFLKGADSRDTGLPTTKP